MAALGVSCFSGKEVRGEILEEIAQLVAVVSGPRCEQLLGAVGRWLLQELAGPCPATQKEPCMGTGYSGPYGTCVTGVNCGGCG